MLGKCWGHAGEIGNKRELGFYYSTEPSAHPPKPAPLIVGKKRDTLENMSTNTAIVAAPIALANLVTVAFTFVDFGVLGRHLGSDKLAGRSGSHR